MNIERMMDIIAENEGGKNWSAWNPDDKGKGISFGRWQFNQIAGGLCSLLKRMHRADPVLFVECFGEQASLMLEHSKLKQMDLTKAGWRFRFTQASGQIVFQACQVAEVVDSYVEPAARMCKDRGLLSWLWLALLTDTCIQYGVGGCKRIIEEAMSNPGIDGLMDTFAELADADQYNRRRKLLAHPELADRSAFMWDNERWGSL